MDRSRTGLASEIYDWQLSNGLMNDKCMQFNMNYSQLPHFPRKYMFIAKGQQVSLCAAAECATVILSATNGLSTVCNYPDFQ